MKRNIEKPLAINTTVKEDRVLMPALTTRWTLGTNLSSSLSIILIALYIRQLRN